MILCRFESQIYQNAGNGYTIAVYSSSDFEMIPAKAVKQDYGCEVTFTAVGNNLLSIENVEIELEGKWEDAEKYGCQFKVNWCRVILPKNPDGIIGYLSSDMVKGIGPVMAKKIVERFGTSTFDVLDKTPEKLLEIKGISENRLEDIMKSYQSTTGIRELMAYLAPFQVTPKKAEKIQAFFGQDAAKIVKETPYRLCEIKGFGFLTVDPIARASQSFTPDDSGRLRAAVRYVLLEAEKEGHLYLEGSHIVDKAYLLLNKGFPDDTVGRNAVIRTGNQMVLEEDALIADGECVFLKENHEAEIRASKDIVRLLKAPVPTFNIERELEEVQAEFGMILAEKQKEAVRMVFQSSVSIITGGPGKGKTTILKVILKIMERVEGSKDILLCAPTGRARKKLSESTGYPALTIHKALYLTDEEDDDAGEQQPINEEMIIADEFTMADMKLASILFSRILSGARLVLVGDVDQLPSVGPGSVFKELIESGIIPVTVLDVFFRQEKDSRIILNADLINKNQKKLLYGGDFIFEPASNDEEAAETIEKIYKKELALHKQDTDMVQVLSPFRVKTKAGIMALNQRLREVANPFSPKKAEWKTGYGSYRIGDKVMQTKNTDEISNGDIGRVTFIGFSEKGDKELEVDYGDLKKKYQEEALGDLEQAYAITIHKSQGAEYPVVIIPVLSCFRLMLMRNVYYTSITRARAKVYLVGSKAALSMAISNKPANRNTLLARRLREEAVLQGYCPEWKKAA